MHPTGDDPVAETAELKARMTALLDETIARLPRRGAAARLLVAAGAPRRHRPHARGGRELDAEEKRERAAPARRQRRRGDK